MKSRILTDAQAIAFSNHLLHEEKSPATRGKYLRDVRRFYVFVGSQPISKETVILWKRHLMDTGYAVRSINSMLASVNSLLTFLGWHDCRVKSIRLQRQAYCTKDAELTRAEYVRLLEASRSDLQLSLILQTICSTGIRVSELQYFTVAAVRNGEITVNCKNKIRTILIPGKLRKMLLGYARQMHLGSGPIFLNKYGAPLDRSTVWRKMKHLCAAAHVAESKVFPHNLRKLFARTFYQNEKDIAKLADILGHSSINTTRIYIMTTCLEHRRQIDRLDLLFPQKIKTVT
ncbi:MAG: integrase [Ruminococcaceae bacterium]|nr:integrase [Oscillospiraceae bacterium]